MTEAVYIVQIREFVRSKEEIYKIGRTSQQYAKRMSSYPKGSLLLILKRVHDSRHMEKKLISLMTKSFQQRTDFGIEYFEGDYEAIEYLFLTTIKQLEEEAEQRDDDTIIIESQSLEIKIPMMDEILQDNNITTSISSNDKQKELISEDIDKLDEKKKKKNKYQREYMRKRLNCKKVYNKDPVENYEEYVKTRYSSQYQPVERMRCQCGKEIYATGQHPARHLASQSHKTMMIRKQKLMVKQEAVKT